MTSIRDANRIAELERKVRELEAWRANLERQLSEQNKPKRGRNAQDG